MNDNDDPYEILGVKSDASDTEIKKNYRKLALKNHPDRQTTDAEKKRAQSVFAKIANAYEILSDPEEREQYDLRKKYGGAPGTRYTTTSSSPGMSQPTYSGSPQYTTRRTSTPAGGPASTQYSQKNGKFTATVTREDGSTYTFSGTANEFQDPYELFRQNFQEKTGEELPGNLQKPPQKQRTTTGSTNQSVPTATQTTTTTARSTPVNNPEPRTVRTGSRTSVTHDGNMKTITKTETLPNGSTRTSMEQVPMNSTTTTSSTTRRPSKTTTAPQQLQQQQPSTTTQSKQRQQQSSAPVGRSMKTRTVQHDDGRVETITETTETMADGTTRSSSSSKISNDGGGSVPSSGRRMIMSSGR